MARKTAVTKPAAVEAKTTTKADAIRAWFKQNPESTAVECQKALKKQGIEIGSPQAQSILNKIKGGSTTASSKIDVAAIKLAADFVAEYGDIDAAIEAIDAVGGFIQSCGSPAKAKAALETYQSVASMITK